MPTCCALGFHHQERAQDPYFINTGNYRTGKQIDTLGGFYAKLVFETCGADFRRAVRLGLQGFPW